jgi:hypothetical protein
MKAFRVAGNGENAGLGGESVQGHLACGLGDIPHPHSSAHRSFSLVWPEQLGLCVPTPQGAGCLEPILNPKWL